MQPLLRDLAAAYSERYPYVSFDFAEMGSTAGLEALRRGNADLALVSRELQPDEESDALTGKSLLAYTGIAEDAIAIIVNEKSPLRALSLYDLRKVFAGQTSTWDELGGSGAISVVSREDGSATRMVFEERVMQGHAVTPTAMVMPGSQAVRDYVAAHEGAIGYVSIGYLGPSVAALAIEGVQPKRETIEDGSYPLTRSFLLVTLPNSSSAVTAFVQFAHSAAGQAIVKRTYGLRSPAK
jgi:phosphate transport system substrate-binding protein